MVDHTMDNGVFIRSMASRGWAGGLSGAVADVIQLLDAAGMDVVMVETLFAEEREEEQAAHVDRGQQRDDVADHAEDDGFPFPRAIARFGKGAVSTLVATDVAARGIHVTLEIAGAIVLAAALVALFAARHRVTRAEEA